MTAHVRFRSARRQAIAIAVALAAIWTAGTITPAAPPPAAEFPQAASQVFPAAAWQRHADPRAAGYCQAGLDAATEKARALATTGMMVVVGGKVLWDYGDLGTLSYLASVRKSILAMLYGKYVANGTIRLDATMADLGIDDVDGLLPQEKQATVRHLLTARSGVYHAAANAACTGCGSTMGDPPGARGSVQPGSYFLYNNWDFNALGTIFEQQTKQDIYDAFAADLAAPLGLEDFDRAAQRKSNAPARSRHPAYHFYLSTRDMARLGYLMLREGQWAGREILSRAWVREMVTPVTRVGEMNPASLREGPFGYGYLWWIWDGPHNQGAYRGAYTGTGAIGQYITVLPAVDMVVAHKTRPSGSASVGRTQYLGVIDAIVGARCGGQASGLRH
jgi:CubicO group peptidase (beta-lactamase class C family)